MDELIKVGPLIEDELKKLWNNKDYSTYYNEQYLYPNDIPTNNVVFIGINPSQNKKYAINGVSYVFKPNGKLIPYFSKFQEVAKACAINNWTHIDLLFIRKTKQKEIESIYKTETGKSFIREQLNLSDKILNSIKPKMIIVCNAFASTLFKERYNLTSASDFDKELGIYRWNGAPVFFSGMLGGQRALDLGSLERLKWHIKRTIELTSAKS